MKSETFDRRVALRGAAAVAAGATLAACGSSSSSTASSTSTGTPTVDSATTFDAIGGPTSAAPDVAAAGASASTGASASAGPAALNGIGNVSTIAVGGGAVFDSAKVVVTQPTAGTYKAFSAICTHQGCAVTGVSNGAINCPCHGSSFSIKDGSVINGPATTGLKEEAITVTQGVIKLGT